MPKHGESRNIKLIVEVKEYDAQLKNQDFDKAIKAYCLKLRTLGRKLFHR